MAVDLERVFADEGGLDDLFELGAENRFPFRNDRIRAWGFGPSFDADVGLDAQQVLAHLEGGVMSVIFMAGCGLLRFRPRLETLRTGPGQERSLSTSTK